jgi:hypothetical protein
MESLGELACAFRADGKKPSIVGCVDYFGAIGKLACGEQTDPSRAAWVCDGSSANHAALGLG